MTDTDRLQTTEPAPAGNGRLLVTPREAARLLSISERTLYSWTKRGDIPVVKLGTAVRYDPKDLAAFVEQKKTA